MNMIIAAIRIVHHELVKIVCNRICSTGICIPVVVTTPEEARVAVQGSKLESSSY
jgi:hypothetical protein